MIEFLATIRPFIFVLHIFICVFLVISILLQAGKGADLGAAFGAGSSQTLFGARGAATFLQKLTTTAAILFLLTSISLTTIHKNRSNIGGGDSVVDQLPLPLDETPKTDVPVEPQNAPADPSKPAGPNK